MTRAFVGFMVSRFGPKCACGTPSNQVAGRDCADLEVAQVECDYRRTDFVRHRESMVGSDVERFLEQALLGEAVMGVPVAASVFDLDRYYVAVNEAFCELTQYERSELTAIKAGTSLAPDDEAREAVQAAIRQRGAVGETNLRRKDGSIIRTAYWVMETRLALGVYFFRLTWRPEADLAPVPAVR